MNTTTDKPKRVRKPKAVEPAPGIIAFKGFDANLRCRGYQYEVGKTFEHEGRVVACGQGFHSCEHPFDVWSYYGLGGGNRFCRVVASGKIDRHSGDSKIASGTIYIETELKLHEMIRAGVDYILAHTDHTEKAQSPQSAATNTGYRSAATNTGYRSAATNTGYQSAATNTGYRSAATNTGDQSAATNTGDRSAATNTGDRSAATNTGYQSAATNTGYRSAASVEGADSVAVAIGHGSRAKASLGSGLVVAERDDDWKLIGLHAAIAGQDGIKPDTWYVAVGGKLVEAA